MNRLERAEKPKRQRVFDIIVNGELVAREAAGNRVGIEVQHELACRTNGFVRVIEKMIGGARPKPEAWDEDS